MVNLERTLAEVEVLIEELGRRYSYSTEEEYHSVIHAEYVAVSDAEKTYRISRSLIGIKKDAELVSKKCKDTYKALKKRDEVSASVSFSEMALDSKNLAENLNTFLQTLYGKYSGNLKDLEANTLTAPILDDGKTIYQTFVQTHDTSKESLMKRARDSKGHNRGQAILFRTPLDPGFPKDRPYYIFFNDERTRDLSVNYLSEDFFKSQAQAYLEMTKTILKTIADKDSEHFKRATGSRRLKTLAQQARNFYQRHSKPIAIAAAATLLTAGTIGGSVGTLAYQNYQKQIEMQQILRKVDYLSDVDGKFRSSYDMWELGLVEDFRNGLIEKRRLELQTFIIAHPEFVSNYNLENVFGTESNLFETVSSGLELKSAQLGIYVDNYISRASVNPTNVIGKTKEFLDRRTKFRKELQSFSGETRGKVPNYAALERLNQLFNEEKDLESIESSIVSGFPHGQLR